MTAYYGDFATAMQRLGTGSYGGVHGFGGTAVVHVEPDLSGYAEPAVLDNAHCYGFCTGQGSDAALLRAAVAGSGLRAVAGYPDTYQGFNRALLHLRDRYAPNVLLAFHVSDWATGHRPRLGSRLGPRRGRARHRGGGVRRVVGVTHGPRRDVDVRPPLQRRRRPRRGVLRVRRRRRGPSAGTA